MTTYKSKKELINAGTKKQMATGILEIGYGDTVKEVYFWVDVEAPEIILLKTFEKAAIVLTKEFLKQWK